MTATITTDASYYSRHKVGAYAFWISTNLFRLCKAGPLKGDVCSSHEAEFKSIVNALHTLHQSNCKITHIYINTDSRTTINAIQFSYDSLWCKDTLKAYKSIVALLNAKVTLRHIKAHIHTNTARNWVNDWCDQEAKKAAIKEIQKRNLVVS